MVEQVPIFIGDGDNLGSSGIQVGDPLVTGEIYCVNDSFEGNTCYEFLRSLLVQTEITPIALPLGWPARSLLSSDRMNGTQTEAPKSPILGDLAIELAEVENEARDRCY
ncbi:hypothetical protein [Synechococcus sp. PCC 7336]|uniref:hypothetical protein n=1 Tax=Synechococcus sp. PCC 7336 TaxID=195250 RepID=UPI00034656E9|nr:hypothetical protein [Synechococcus sp. PCC 7336]